jgi:outer membrane receptor protein involved in Fe transport
MKPGMPRFFLPLLFFFSPFLAVAQTGRVSGRVLSDRNEPLAGVTVTVVTSVRTATGPDGSFTLSLPTGRIYEIVFSSVGFATKTLGGVEVFSSATTELNVTLEAASKDLTAVTVQSSSSTARRENVNALIQFQKNTNTVASVISAEAIRRSPDRNTGEVLKRTPGASLQDGRFLIIRGLADRYNQAMLNGVLLTSTEPDRKTFSFDLIPSSMIDNIVINKAFVPELPGEWAGGLVQVNTKDIPARGFFTIQLGTGFNTQTIGRGFHSDKGGRLDWLGIDDGSRGLPATSPTKSQFDALSPAQKTAIGASLPNSWVSTTGPAPLNVSVQANGGFSTRLGSKKLGGTFGLLYNKSGRYQSLLNQSNGLVNGVFSTNTRFDDDRYVREATIGAIGGVSLQFNPLNRISLKTLLNVQANSAVTQRTGVDLTRQEEMRGSEFSFRQNTFFTTQLTGDHSLPHRLKLKWYGAFTILDSYTPDQRRILYTRPTGSADPFRLLLSNSLSQQSGSRIFQSLNDYIYTAGGDLSWSFPALGRTQSIKGGYLFQVKDRLYDGQFFANYQKVLDESLKLLPADQVFAPQNFGDNKISFDAIRNRNFRYMANTILNAGFLQMDNLLTPELRVVWGVRVEDYDQLVGSPLRSDPRHTYSRVRDLLPGLNATYKLNGQTNLRLSGSQTVIRPELRELTALNIYDFELNASVSGNPLLKRTKITNLDLRYELYPRPGEAFTVGLFYKSFRNPIEQYFDEAAGGASTFTFVNTEKARVFGVEVELRKRLDFIPALSNFTFQSNASWIDSRVRSEAFSLDRPLQGQSPYVLNAGLLYDLPKAGLNATLLYNQVGRRLYYVGQNSLSIGGAPDIYEAPRPVLDLQVAKKMLKGKGEVRAGVSDLLNQTQYFYQNATGDSRLDKGTDAYRFTRRPGTTVSVSASYSF